MADLLSTLFGTGAVALLCTYTSGTDIGAIEGKQIGVVVKQGKSEVSIHEEPVMEIRSASPHTITFAVKLSETKYSHGFLNRVTGEMYFSWDNEGQPLETNYLTCKRVEPLF